MQAAPSIAPMATPAPQRQAGRFRLTADAVLSQPPARDVNLTRSHQSFPGQHLYDIRAARSTNSPTTPLPTQSLQATAGFTLQGSTATVVRRLVPMPQCHESN